MLSVRRSRFLSRRAAVGVRTSGAASDLAEHPPNKAYDAAASITFAAASATDALSDVPGPISW